MATVGPCRLCGTAAELQGSHVLPAFVFKWIKGTSGTGFLRFNQVPNKRVQDGETCPWLCVECEGRFNVWETQFATKVFHPLNEDGGQQIRYGDWLLKFCVSVSWRALLWMQENGGLQELDGAQQQEVAKALEAWRRMLLGLAPHPGRCEQHLLPLDAIESITPDNLPANINRYVLRTVAIDVVHSASANFVYTKLGKFLVLGFIDVAFPRQWVGTKVHVSEGTVGRGEFTVPIQFADYLAEKAKQLAGMHAEISDNQRQSIAETMKRGIDRVAQSDSFTAMQHDVDRSGTAAFEIHSRRRR